MLFRSIAIAREIRGRGSGPAISRLLYRENAAAAAEDITSLDRSIRCPSRPGYPTRIMSVNDQLISLAAHNAYHLGRIVLLRQLLQAWPPASGGFTW